MIDTLINPKKWEHEGGCISRRSDTLHRNATAFIFFSIALIYAYIMGSDNYADNIVTTIFFSSYTLTAFFVLFTKSCDRLSAISVFRWVIHGGLVSAIYGVYPDLPIRKIVLLACVFIEPPLSASLFFFNKLMRATLEGTSQSPSIRRWQKHNGHIVRLTPSRLNVLLSIIFILLAAIYTSIALDEHLSWSHMYYAYVIIDITKNILVAFILIMPSRIVVVITTFTCALASIYSFILIDNVGVIRHACINVPVCVSIILYLLFSDRVRLQAFGQIRS
ncbi:MAG: hypothetical protein NVV74_21485 [Magnetospirillum sp.]|nr:hypothetical protein [Magnetospirillum sp.]